METIILHHPHQLMKEECPPTVVALGYFDGVHKGHQQVINTAKQIAETNHYQSAVMTFDPHPSVVLGKFKGPIDYITPIDKKKEVIAELGIDRLYIVKFTKPFADLLPQEFVDQYLIGLNIKHVVAGFDYTYGKLGKGTMETLPFHSRNQLQQTTVSKIDWYGEKISSTLIRKSILDGDVTGLSNYLGRYYSVEGVVVHGDKRGRTIGFPTANVKVEDYLIPPVGVYAVRMKVRSKWVNGVCNIGYKPTFHNEAPEKPSIEVHLFDYNEEIYGEQVTIEWHKRIRNEMKFASIDQLVSQINKDKQEALEYFNL